MYGMSIMCLIPVVIDEIGQFLHKFRLEGVDVLMNISVSISDNAPVRSMSSRTNAAYEISLISWHVWDGDRFYTDKHEDAMKCGEVGDKPAKVGWDSRGKISEDNANPRYPRHSQAWT